MFSKGAALRLAIITAFSMQASLYADSLFRPTSSYAAGWVTKSIAAGDINGDGYPDLVAADAFGVRLLVGNGTGTFRYFNSFYTGGSYANSVAVEDVNGDGKLDVVVAHTTIGVLLGNGDGTFQSAVSYDSGGPQARSIAVSDINHDGKPDMFAVNATGVSALLANGDGTFQPAVTYDSGGYQSQSIAVADVNGDADPDLLVTNTCLIYPSSCDTGIVGVLLGNGDGTFQAVQQYSSQGTYANGIAVGDINGDGRPDVVVATLFGRFGILLGNGDGTFRPAGNYSSGANQVGSIALGDVNADGKLDLVTGIQCLSASDCKGRVGVLFGNGNATFQSAQFYSSGGHWPMAVAVEDVNGDSMPDVLVANECDGRRCDGGRLGVLINKTPGFVTTTRLRSSPNPSLYGQTVTLKAAVTSAGPITSTGTVAFWNDVQWLGRATLNGGVAVLQRKNLPAGTLHITAHYNGDTVSAKSASPPITQIVMPLSPAP